MDTYLGLPPTILSHCFREPRRKSHHTCAGWTKLRNAGHVDKVHCQARAILHANVKKKTVEETCSMQSNFCSILPSIVYEVVVPESKPTRLVGIPSAGPLCLEPRYGCPENGDLALFPRGQPIILQHLGSKRRREVAKPVRSITARQREALRTFVQRGTWGSRISEYAKRG